MKASTNDAMTCFGNAIRMCGASFAETDACIAETDACIALGPASAVAILLL